MSYFVTIYCSVPCFAVYTFHIRKNSEAKTLSLHSVVLTNKVCCTVFAVIVDKVAQ